MAWGEYMYNELRDFVLKELLSGIEPEEFDDDSNLLEFGLDSLSMMHLVDFIETRYQINLPDEEIVPSNMKTLNLIKLMIASNLVSK